MPTDPPATQDVEKLAVGATEPQWLHVALTDKNNNLTIALLMEVYSCISLLHSYMSALVAAYDRFQGREVDALTEMNVYVCRSFIWLHDLTACKSLDTLPAWRNTINLVVFQPGCCAFLLVKEKIGP